MARSMRCRDVGMDCDFVAQGDTEADIMRQVAEHVRSVHGMKHVAPELAIRIRSVIREETVAPPPGA